MTKSVRRGIVSYLMLGAVAFSGAGPASLPSAHDFPARPNIVVIMADDLDVGLLTRLESLGYAPNLRTQILDRGTRFTNAAVTNSLCCPSRATYLTGQYSHNHGVRVNDAPDGGVFRFDDRNTVATWLHDAGYRTGYVGKYLNGYGNEDVTKDGRVTIADRRYVPPGWTDWQVLLDHSVYNVFNYDINDNGQIVRHGSAEVDYQTDVLARRAARFIQDADRPESDSAPFFLTVMPLAPHFEMFWWTIFDSPWQWDIRPAPRHEGTLRVPLPRPLSFNEGNLSDKPEWMQQHRPKLTSADISGLTRHYRHRLESLRAIDDLIGTIVAALEAADELDNTVIMFTSDNGFLHGEHRLSQKLMAYEESIRVPLFVRVPGGSPSTLPQVVLNNDLAPTIAELAGVAPALLVDGTSFVRVLRQPVAEWRRRFLVEHWETGAAPKFEIPTYVAVRAMDTHPSGMNALYVQYENPAYAPELYDLRFDPFQVWSQHAATDPARVALQQSLRGWITGLSACQGETCRTLEFLEQP